MSQGDTALVWHIRQVPVEEETTGDIVVSGEIVDETIQETGCAYSMNTLQAKVYTVTPEGHPFVMIERLGGTTDIEV